MFELIKNNEILMTGKYWEDLEQFVEDVKKLNPHEIDRRQFKIKFMNSNEVFKEWKKN